MEKEDAALGHFYPTHPSVLLECPSRSGGAAARSGRWADLHLLEALMLFDMPLLLLTTIEACLPPSHVQEGEIIP